MDDENAKFICEIAGFDGIEGWRFQCPGCQGTWDETEDVRRRDVQCPHCQWKGKASS